MRHRDKKSQPSGFTMIELLIVIAIMTLLTTLLVGATWRFVAGTRESATATTILKIDGIIQDRVRAFREFDFTDAAIAAANQWNLSNQFSGWKDSTGQLQNNSASWNSTNSLFTSNHTQSYLFDQISASVAEILVRKVRFKKAFPQSFTELDGAQRDRLFGVGVTLPPSNGGYSPKYESGIVLYAFLMKGETFGSATPGDDTFSGAEIKNTEETGNLPCLVDAWGEPLRFYRWPTRLIRCGEQNFSGTGAYDDYNQNGQQDDGPHIGSFGSGGCIDAAGNPIFTPAIRPYSVFPRPTPASLLMANLPPFDRTTAYAKGADTAPGVSGINDDSVNGTDDPGEIGWPDTDDPEPLNTDPDDPAFKLSNWLFDANIVSDKTSNQMTAQQQLRRLYFVNNVVSSAPFITNVTGNPQQNGFHDFYTFHTPLIVSAGPNRKLGLAEPSDLVNFGNLAAPLQPPPGASYANYTMPLLLDDISNLNQRVGVR